MRKDKWVIIPAAGFGERFADDLPKQYHQIRDKSILEHTLSIFISRNDIKGIIVALSKSDTIFNTLAIAKHPMIRQVVGGQTRSLSVLNALNALTDEALAADWVLVHDAVRPCLHKRDLEKIIATLKNDKVGGILASPVVDTLKKANNQGILQTQPRTHLWCALTPQMFRFQLLLDALVMCQQKGITVTDEAQAIEEAGLEAKLVSGDYPNPKLTYAVDKILIDSLLKLQSLDEHEYV